MGAIRRKGEKPWHRRRDQEAQEGTKVTAQKNLFLPVDGVR
jgi:hypothetical protein